MLIVTDGKSRARFLFVLPNCAKSFVTRGGFRVEEKQVVAPKVTVTVPVDGKWHEYADKKRSDEQVAPAV